MKLAKTSRIVALTIGLMLALSFATAGLRHHVPTPEEIARHAALLSSAEGDSCPLRGRSSHAGLLDAQLCHLSDDGAILPPIQGQIRRLAADRTAHDALDPRGLTTGRDASLVIRPRSPPRA